MCNQFNNLINTLKKEVKIEMGEKYPWLDKMDETKYVSVREILEKYINLEKCAYQKKKKRKLWTFYINIKKHLV